MKLANIEKDKLIKRISWTDFRAGGFLFHINQMLHPFGLAIVVNVNDNNEILETYPARCKFRGFDNKSTEKGYQEINDYLKDNIESILTDLEGDEDGKE